MNALRRIALASLLLCVFASPLMAQQRLRVAIFDFQNNSEKSYWFSGDLGPSLRNMLDTAFSENAELARMFAVVERDKLNLVLKEQGLGGSGALDPQTAAKVGRILGVKYIVTGAIDTFTINSTEGASARFGVGGKLVQAKSSVNIRFIDTTTAERVLAVSADGEVKKGGGFFRGNSLSRDAEWGIASETLTKISKSLVEKMTKGGYLDRIQTAAGVLEGKVIKVDGNQAWINLGSSSGVKVGDTFRVINMGEELVDPDTGVKLGAQEKETGSIQVTEVQEKFAVATVKGTAKAKDTIRHQQ